MFRTAAFIGTAACCQSSERVTIWANSNARSKTSSPPLVREIEILCSIRLVDGISANEGYVLKCLTEPSGPSVRASIDRITFMTRNGYKAVALIIQLTLQLEYFTSRLLLYTRTIGIESR